MGSATFLVGDLAHPLATLEQEDTVVFGTPAQDQDFFAVVWDFNLFGGSGGALGQALTASTTLPVGAVLGQSYYVLAWKWQVPPPTDVCPLVNGDQGAGPCADTLCVLPATWSVDTQSCVEPPPPPPPDTSAPVITITNPLKYGLYERTDTVFLTATIVDASPIVESTYWLNGKKINQLVPLIFNSSTPLVSKVSVAAMDSAGNWATSTLAFFVVKNKSSCLTSVVAILLALAQDKTLPDKPTIQNLIENCKCLNLGQHHWDWNHYGHH